MAEEDFVDIESHIPPDNDAMDDPYAGGTLHQPDQTDGARQSSEMEGLVREGIERERKFYDDAGKPIITVNTNLSGAIQFKRYTMNAAMDAVQIVNEKKNRGDIVIVCYDGTLSVGLHRGITALGMDTVSIVGSASGTARVLRTRNSLWAIVTDTTVFDVQEEFD